jgi:hypothetical protein
VVVLLIELTVLVSTAERRGRPRKIVLEVYG